ncbi:MAG: hypothetical protein IJW44_04435 [Clostridia bacterium]|nr:hypothetical protein [Clostridia bacterium]
MYKISVPIMSATMNPDNREIYVKQFRQAGAKRVFLAIGTPVEPIPQTLSENVQYLKAEGFEVGIWIDTVGHGFVLAHVEADSVFSEFSQIVNIQGERRDHACCPMDEDFRRYIAGYVAKLAGIGADIVMLDDDFRMSQHGGELCCACPAHLRRMGEILGEEITLEQIRPYVLSGKANRYRDAWLQAQNEGLVALAREIRTQVDREHPEVTVCNCTAYAPWNVDGTDVAGIARILAGKNRPLLRATGGPYWATKPRRQFSLISTFEISRMLASFVFGEGIELMSEGDVYPRPRYTCPGSYLELYDAVTRIDGVYDGILKYMFDYVSGPEMETGYLRLHGENRPFLERDIPALFPKGVNAGVRIIARPHTMKHADLDLTRVSELSPRPLDGTMLGSCGIPTLYRGRGFCNSAFGENARLMDLSELGEGTILDAVSAVILTQRGVDVGLSSYGALAEQTVSFLCTRDESFKSLITDGEVRMLPATLREGAEPLLFSTDPTGKQTVAYRYENGSGERFLVFLFEGDSIFSTARVCNSGMIQNPVIQRVLTETLPWVARQPIPVSCVGNPNLYLMCAKEENAMSVALFNCFADSLVNPVIRLGESYDRMECLGCQAVLEGDKVTLTSKQYGFTWAAFRVYRQESEEER